MAATDRGIAASLAIAAGILLDMPTGEAASLGLLDDDRWESEVMLLVYSEPDRVQAIEPVIGVKRILDTDRELSLRLTLDTLTGASGTGAVPWREPQTFTRPSGNGSYTTAAGDTPLDDTFKDTRVAVAGSYSGPVAAATTLDAGLNFSTEYDYRSIGVSAGLSREFDRNNRTASIGVAFASDRSDPVGGVPVAFAAMPRDRRDFGIDGATTGIDRATASADRASSDDKTVTDVLFGFTQVIDRRSLVQFNIGLGQIDGYQNDPYKFLSVLDASGEPVYADRQAGLPLVAYENRPDSRSKQSLYVQYKRDFDGSVLGASYRFNSDDWGITGNTVELRYRILRFGGWIEPSFRYYRQSEADFFQPFLVEGELPEVGDETRHASADYRLGALDAITLGLGYGQGAWNLRLEYYLQQSADPDTGGRLAGLDLSPDVDAILFRIGTRF